METRFSAWAWPYVYVGGTGNGVYIVDATDPQKPTLLSRITSPEVGHAYRRAILEPNGSMSGDDLVAGFLGRPASIESFLRMRGMAVPAEVSAG